MRAVSRLSLIATANGIRAARSLQRNIAVTSTVLQSRVPPPGVAPSRTPPKPTTLVDASGNPLRPAPPAAASAGKPAGKAAAARPAPQQQSPIVEVNESNFQAMVLQSPVAVVLDCYADWCDPCKVLTPKLENIVTSIAQKGGAFVRLAKLNVDACPGIAGQLGVRSLPSVLGIVGGQMVDSFTGAATDDTLKKFFGNLLKAAEQAGMLQAPGSSPLEQVAAALSESNALIDEGGHEEALTTLPELLETLQKLYTQVSANLKAENEAKAKRENKEPIPVRTDIGILADIDGLVARAIAALVRALLAKAQSTTTSGVEEVYEQARSYADILRTRYKTSIKDPEVSRALAAVDLAAGAEKALEGMKPLIAAVSADPSDHSKRFELAEAQIGAGQHQKAVDNLLHIMQKAGAAWQDGKARTTLLKLFETLGPASPVTLAGRKALSKLLFR